MFSDLLDTTGRDYGECMLVVENNNLGYALLEKLQTLEYPNLYWSVKSTHEYLEPHLAEHRHGAVPGFTTSMKTRPLIVAKLEEFARNKLITVHSSRTLNELKTFIWNNSKPEAMQGYNDDLTISLAIACWVRDTALITNQRAVEYNKAVLGSMVSSQTVLDTKVPGQRGYKVQSKSLDHQVKQIKEFSWLLKG